MDSISEKENNTFENFMKNVGMDGKFQLRFNLLFNVAAINIISMSAFNIILALTVPGHWCHVPGRNETNFTLEQWKELNIPMNDDGYTYSKCKMYNFKGGTHMVEDGNGTDQIVTDCQHGWEYDTTWYELTAPAQENWVCNQELYVTNAIFFCRAGEAIGTLIFGQLGDIIGRRPVMLLSMATLVLGRCMSALTSGTYYLFLASCFIGNSPIVAVSLTPLIVAVEMSSKEQRAHIAMVQTLGWVGGLCVLPIIAWITAGEWKTMLLASSLPILSIFFIQKLFLESPRWLATKGKYEECEKVLRQISDTNGRVFTGDTLSLLENMDQKKETTFGLAGLVSSWRLARNTFLLCCCVFTCHFLYYTVTILVTSLSGNPYITFFLQAFVEFPATILGWVACDKIGRRWTHATAYTLASIALLVISFVVNMPNLQWMLTGLVVFSKFVISITLYVAFLLNAEMYPTCVRQAASSLGYVTSSTLGLVAPYIAYLGSAVDIRYPYIILATLAAMGTLCSLLLPETLNQKLPETLADAAHFGCDQKFWSLPPKTNKRQSKFMDSEEDNC